MNTSDPLPPKWMENEEKPVVLSVVFISFEKLIKMHLIYFVQTSKGLYNENVLIAFLRVHIIR